MRQPAPVHVPDNNQTHGLSNRSKSLYSHLHGRMINSSSVPPTPAPVSSTSSQCRVIDRSYSGISLSHQPRSPLFHRHFTLSPSPSPCPPTTCRLPSLCNSCLPFPGAVPYTLLLLPPLLTLITNAPFAALSWHPSRPLHSLSSLLRVLKLPTRRHPLPLPSQT